MDGSSIKIIFGLDISALPIASICCSPPDSVPAIWFLRSSRRGNFSYTIARLRAYSSRSLRV